MTTTSRARRRRILWANIPARFWLWRHMRHESTNLTGKTWTCSCGSARTRRAGERSAV